MQIDCRNLTCPQPLINTKNALNKMSIGEELEILVNENEPLQNVQKFIQSAGLKCSVIEISGYHKIITTKTKEIPSNDGFLCDENHFKRPKVLYFKDDKIGDLPIGQSVMETFLGSLTNMSNKPDIIICINNGVKMTTMREHYAFSYLKELEKSGVEIISCGNCLKALSLLDKLAIGKVGNAYEIANLVISGNCVSL